MLLGKVAENGVGLGKRELGAIGLLLNQDGELAVRHRGLLSGPCRVDVGVLFWVSGEGVSGVSYFSGAAVYLGTGVLEKKADVLAAAWRRR